MSERVYDRAEAEALLKAWEEHDTPAQIVAIEMATRYHKGVLGPLADLINERVRALAEAMKA